MGRHYNMEKITLVKNRHILVKDDDENVFQNEVGDWLILDLKDNRTFYITPTLEVLNFLNLITTSERDCSNAIDFQSTNSMKDFNTCNAEESDKENRVIEKWDRSAILSLIELFKKNYDNFKNTCIKNEHVWMKITNKINERGFNFTKTQIENKFKYLKQRYIKKKDNMGNKSTGESPMIFDYFLEFDKIFGLKPSVTPLAIASSSKLQVNIQDDSIDENSTLQVNIQDDSTDENSTNEPEMKKLKISRLDRKIEGWKEYFTKKDEEKEKARERRHREKLDIAEKTMKIMEKLIDKL